MNVRKFVVGIVGIVVAVLIAADSCGTNTPANAAEQNQVSSQQDIYDKNQPVHTYTYSNERAILQQIYDLRVNGNINTWDVWFSNNGIPLGSCESKGYPIPYGTELTNPNQISYSQPGGTWVSGVVGQMDPNGLYPTANSLGDFVLCLGNDGQYYSMFVEPMIVTYPFPVEVQNGRVVQTGSAPAGSAINPTKATK